MKAAPRQTHGFQQRSRRWKKTRAHSELLYKSHKEVSPVAMRSLDLLSSRVGFPRPVLLRLVSSEASRLSRTNRVKVVTGHEINAAVALLRLRINTRAAA